ncbi:SirB2 [Enterobacter cancerogenus]|uniref:SirB2 n=1 Tax=Enterobacter cancerogenus TaxID=69218 RepID=A0A484W970_9ENTR|nr:SirB2 [Enterobacter cancerogenus]
MSLFTVLITVHLVCVALTIAFFIVRYAWRYSNNPLIDARWVRICAALYRHAAVPFRGRVDVENGLSAILLIKAHG